VLFSEVAQTSPGECWTIKQLEQFVNVIAGSPEVVQD